MKSLLRSILVLLVVCAQATPAPTQNLIDVRIDYFSPFKDHAAIRMARTLRSVTVSFLTRGAGQTEPD